MKQLIRRLSRVADSSQYSLLRSDSHSCRSSTVRRADSFRSLVKAAKRSTGGKAVPQGYVSVYVGEEMEYGYEQQGGLQIPCHVLVFERVMEVIRLGL
ncbi:Auxin-responsive protein SAUR72 [Linum perenne]